MTDGRPLASIVTVCLDARWSIGRTIESVLAQRHRPLEHLIVDGGSSDGTQDVIRGYDDRIARWISEPDGGISDAFNKGIALARGTWIGLLNSDDWMEPDQVGELILAAERDGADFAFGDLLYHEPDGRVAHRVRGDPDYGRHLPRRMPDVNHPTMLVHRRVYERVGGYDPGFRYAMDYDWLCRVHAAGFRGVHCSGVTGHMTLDGASDRHHRGARREDRRIAINYGVPAAAAWPIYFYRIVKGGIRRMLRHTAPEPAYHWLRQRVNRGYEPPE